MLLGELRRWGNWRGGGRRAAPGRRPGARVDRRRSATATATATSSTSARATAACENQGWKDSWDAIRFADGRLAEPPIALCEVQGYVYAALRRPGPLRRRDGRRTTSPSSYRRQGAPTSRRRSTATSGSRSRAGSPWASTRDKRPIDALASNMGHCLWTGHRRRGQGRARGRAAAVADEMFAAGASARWRRRWTGYNPISYHSGAVWPHDNAHHRRRPDALRLRRGGARVIMEALDAAAAHRRPAARAVRRAGRDASSRSR